VVDRGVRGPYQNYLTPEQHIPEKGLPYPWETCMTMGDSWSYKPDDRYKSTNEIIRNLVDIVSKGGNYLLNIGPGPDGEFDTTAYQRLREVGVWMRRNGEAIYGTRMYKVYGEGKDIRFTQSKDGKTQYIFLLERPKEKLTLSTIKLAEHSTLRFLGSTATLNWTQNAGRTEIDLHGQTTGEHVWVIMVQQP
jgi:alpha-L-fucosidase